MMMYHDFETIDSIQLIKVRVAKQRLKTLINLLFSYYYRIFPIGGTAALPVKKKRPLQIWTPLTISILLL
jgi:hypothetical protein